MNHDADRPLVLAAQRGESAAFTALYEKYSKKIIGFARKFIGDEHLAEDIVQEVFLQVYRKISKFRGEARFSTWLFRVSMNACKSKAQSLERQRRLQDEQALSRIHQPTPSQPENILSNRELKEQIDTTLGSLSSEQRDLLLMKSVRELSYVEIGQATNQSENQVRGKLYRARKAFRSQLEARRPLSSAA